MLGVLDYSEAYDFGRIEPYRGEVPDAVGKLILVVRTGQFKQESWIFCDDKRVEKVKDKYGSNFVRVAGRMLIDRKPIRIPLVENYSRQISEIDEDLLLASFDEKSDSVEKEDSQDNNPLLDLPRLARAVGTLTPQERKLFDLWSDKRQPKNHERALGVTWQTAKVYRVNVRKKLAVAFGAKNSDDFEKRMLAIAPMLKKFMEKGDFPPSEVSYQKPEVQKTHQHAEPVKVEAPRRVVTFNEFLQAYGNRKDAIKALEQFNKVPADQQRQMMDFIPKYKASIGSLSAQKSPYQYIVGREWVA